MKMAARIACVVLAIAAAVVWAAAAQQPDYDVLKVIPENYKLIIDNPFVRVLEARIPAGTEEKPHRHMKRVSVCLSEYTLESRTLPMASGCATSASWAPPTGATPACTRCATWARPRATRSASS